MKNDVPISPGGTPIDVRPISRGELGQVLLRCLPDGGRIETLFKMQETVGFGAWEGERCIAQLHGYRVAPAEGDAGLWPSWSRPSYIDDILSGALAVAAPVWCHACFHVGRSIESFAHSDEPDARYFHRGIGTALARCSVNWARQRGYASVVASGTPDDLFAFSVWAGGLPWTTYRALGFDEIGRQRPDTLPEWTKWDAPANVMPAVARALDAGRPKSDLHSRIMVLNLR